MDSKGKENAGKNFVLFSQTVTVILQHFAHQHCSCQYFRVERFFIMSVQENKGSLTPSRARLYRNPFLKSRLGSQTGT